MTKTKFQKKNLSIFDQKNFQPSQTSGAHQKIPKVDPPIQIHENVPKHHSFMIHTQKIVLGIMFLNCFRQLL